MNFPSSFSHCPYALRNSTSVKRQCFDIAQSSLTKGSPHATVTQTEGVLLTGTGWGCVALIRMLNGVFQQLNDLLRPFKRNEGFEFRRIEDYSG